MSDPEIKPVDNSLPKRGDVTLKGALIFLMLFVILCVVLRWIVQSAPEPQPPVRQEITYWKGTIVRKTISDATAVPLGRLGAAAVKHYQYDIKDEKGDTHYNLRGRVPLVTFSEGQIVTCGRNGQGSEWIEQ
jgi:hypothetical protein